MNSNTTTAFCLGDLLPHTPNALHGIPISGISCDSRSVNLDEIFFCRTSCKRERDQYINQAVTMGAAVIVAVDGELATLSPKSASKIIAMPTLGDVRDCLGLAVDKFYEQASKSLRIYGVTGTDGKTSVCSFISQLYGVNVCANIGTLGVFLDNKCLATTKLTTPDTLDLHGLLKKVVDHKARAAALELSSHGLHQDRLTGLRLHTAVLTNISCDHMDYHKNLEHYLAAKSLLFKRTDIERCVINADDSSYEYIKACAQANVVSYGIEHKATFKASDIVLSDKNIKALLATPWGSKTLYLPLCGRFNLYNALAALAALADSSQTLESAIEACAKLCAPIGRLQSVENQCGLAIYVDFAHTAHALNTTLTTLRELYSGRLWCIFGCGGERDRSKRAAMGSAAEHSADFIVLTNDNPRQERPEKIIDDIVAGIDDKTKLQIFLDRAMAIAYVLQHALAGDTVLIAGKGHEDYIDIGEHHVPFNDVQVVHDCLAKITA